MRAPSPFASLILPAVGVLTLALAIACSAKPRGEGFDDAGSSGSSGGGIFTDDGGDASSGQACSGDLRSVLDSTGNIIKTCAAEEGCAGGQCVAACDAAAASQGSLG